MKSSRFVPFLASLVIVGVLVEPALAQSQQPVTYIVVVDRQPSNAAIDRVRDDLVTRHNLGGRLQHVYRSALSGFSVVISEQEAEALAHDPNVLSVRKDTPVSIFDTVVGGPVILAKPGADQTVPTGISRILAARSSLKAGDGKTNVTTNISVAVVDTGVDLTHPDLSIAVGIGYDATGSGTLQDQNGHGTHVAGTVGAANNSYGVVGVAPRVTIVPVKVLGAGGGGTWDGVIAGWDWVAQNAAAYHIVAANNSFGAAFPADQTPCSSTTDGIHLALCGMRAAGVVPVAAAGNNAIDIAGFVPAGYQEALTVAAFADSDGRFGGLGASTWAGADDSHASFSDYATFGTSGPNHLIGAPGVNILSTWPSGQYATLSGTSMASPHVTGTIAACYNRGRCTSVNQAVNQVMSDAANAPPAYGFAGDYPHPISNQEWGYAVTDSSN